jgi:SAM-dependent methyltransferase
MTVSSKLSSALDSMFERPEGLYGRFEDIPVISQKGHFRRMELLEKLEIGDVTNMTCIDFGMGSWGFAACYGKLHHCARAIGLDISATAIAKSKQLIAESKPIYSAKFEAMQSDGSDLPLPDSSVDLFFSGESIEHVTFPPRFLCEIYRVLRPGGQLVLTTPNRDALHYKSAGEEYCTSPEHFWLFNYHELVDAVQEYFKIEEIYGFNGTFGFGKDLSLTDEKEAESWSREFLAKPELASGIVLRATKRPNVEHRYEIFDVPLSDVRIEGSDRYLDLEFGLKGVYLAHEGARVTILRPASDGVVCRFWCHRWSGIARLETPLGEHELDLYAYDPGWRNWVDASEAILSSEIRITPTLKKNAKALDTQILYFQAFCWKVTGDRSRPTVTFEARDAGYGFDRVQPFVSTTVFHWFTATEGNIQGPWQPIGGRAVWDGSVDFWRRQIYEMMMANIDAIYLHCIDQFEPTRLEFFRAYAQLRSEGWDVPKIAPFLDPYYLWRTSPIDVATEEGKNEFVRHYIRFYEQYFSLNTDSHAHGFLLTIDGQLALSTWWVYSLLKNIEALTREDVLERLRARLGRKIPQLNSGLYMISTALIDPDLSFSDERVVMFSGFAYAIHSVHKGIDVWHVQAGYWDQNIRRPGYFMPRDGGKNYRRAWDAVVANKPTVHRVYIESWNEYDEGSGIYAADASHAVINEQMHRNTDTFSDTGDPYEYIRTTARGAALIGRTRPFAARFLAYEPHAVKAGEIVEICIQLRNEGTTTWSNSDGFGLYIEGYGVASNGLISLNEGSYGDGPVVRGQASCLRFNAIAPDRSGTWELKASLYKGGLRFGDPAALSIRVR